MTERRTVEEITSFGDSAGVEIENVASGEDVSIGEPFNPDDIDITTRTMTIDLLLSRIETGAIDLQPDFQRRAGIWNEKQQSRLIESLLLRIPLPTLYAAEDENEDWAIVDGIQRLSTIVRFISPSSIGLQPLRLRKLEYLGGDFDDCIFDDLPARLRRRLRETELVIHLIKHGTPDEVKFNIFARINTGGMPLSAQELRHALIPGNARITLRRLAESKSFRQATGDSIRDERMADKEMILRFIAFRLSSPNSYRERDFDRFLSNSMRNINILSSRALKKLEKEFYKAMETAHAIFDNDAFRKRYTLKDSRYPINKALFETFSVALSLLTEDQHINCINNAIHIKKGFIALMRDGDFDSSISQGTGDASKIRRRFSSIKNLIMENAND
ncbi:DUF262 domain-containing protein [Pseudomonas sp. P42]|uniref:DUF262 domain-containing protein n=1 Tax=Pseudomonas sp. P42 TaxID=1080160 RepID=UPI001B338A86|nr:DUF262 domain-containing protein [Pseudomonas sp. P42]MBP5953422.1 DUF262 domain-containing protein [Pseudomonas sp. P42]